MPSTPAAAANCSGEGSMWGSGIDVSAISSMPKKTAPGICVASYSLRASRVPGRCQLPSTMPTLGSWRCAASHSVETNQRVRSFAIVSAGFGEADADAAVLLALRFHLADRQTSNLGSGTDVGAAAGLEVDVADAHQTDAAAAHR